jgi:kinetochore protein Mis13/DSN1
MCCLSLIRFLFLFRPREARRINENVRVYCTILNSRSHSRVVLNAEEQPGGLRIVRGHSAAPPSSNPIVPPPRPPSSQSQRPTDAGPSRQPSKKFRSGSQPLTSRTKSGSRTHERGITPSTQEDLDIEQVVCAMEDEADNLRRNSRAHTTIDPSVRLSITPAFQFPPRPPDSDTPKRRKSKITDTSVPLPSDESPQIERNRLLREGAMAAIANGRGRQSNGTAGGGHRRKSSINSRGKRISSSFEATGVISKLI